ncbi:cysteine desulfurase family protein [Lysobacter sp. CA196]|uniref:cysteine desulfurase family protein n=1 Tax=Lysobacter sp. CA196 TaxID=3455606 RepID=UPI003F8CF572
MIAPYPIYLDHNATTPLEPAVFEAMRPYFLEHFGNPSSIDHLYGQTAAGAIQTAREQVAAAIGAQASEITFTGSCTESDNMAILGVARALATKGHFITSRIEHPAVLEAFRQLENEGHSITYLPVDDTGQIRLDELASAFRPETALVSIMGANNEVGTLQPLVQIGALCAQHSVLLHADLAQMPAYLPIDVTKLGVDLASFSGHKIYGPKGVGALYVRRRRPRTKLSPLLWGGGQEKALRPGTLNTPLIVGLGAAMEFGKKHLTKTASHVNACNQRLLEILREGIDGVQVNGHPIERLPNNLALSIEGVEPLALMRLLRETVAFSASSACATETVETSHVLLAMFGDTARARTSFRLSTGRHTKLSDITSAAQHIVEGVSRLRQMG